MLTGIKNIDPKDGKQIGEFLRIGLIHARAQAVQARDAEQQYAAAFAALADTAAGTGPAPAGWRTADSRTSVP